MSGRWKEREGVGEEWWWDGEVEGEGKRRDGEGEERGSGGAECQGGGRRGKG